MRLFLFLIGFLSLSQSVLCVDFHDFDVYQYKLTAHAVEQKIKAYLEQDPAIRKFYRLTPEALYLGDLDLQQIDYVLHLQTDPLPPPFQKEKRDNNGLQNKKIAIDPGHFGGEFAELEERYLAIPAEKTKDRNPIWFCEGDLTYLTALELKRLLEAEGASVLVTRPGIGQGAIQENFFEWMRTHPDLERSEVSLPQIFRKVYNREDLAERARKINEFSPDFTIVIHYNMHMTDREKREKTLLTQMNYSLAFIPGAFGANELQEAKDRYEFLRLIVTDDLEESLKLSESIVGQFAQQLRVPLASWKINAPCLIQKPGVYGRNLALTRLVHGPICYGETLIQNHREEVYRLAARDHSIAGVSCPKRVAEVAYSYYLGIKEYLSK